MSVSRKKTKSRTAGRVEARPQPAQIEAVHRLIDAGALPEAEQRLKRLQRQFPGYKPLYALAWQLAERGGAQSGMVAAAWDWTQASPNSLPAWSALYESCLPGFEGLALRAAQRLAELEGGVWEGEGPQSLPHPFGDITPEIGAATDLCLALLGVQRFAEAERVARTVDHPLTINNLGVACFAQGRLDDARAHWENAWRKVPGNLFALERLVMATLWLKGYAAAAEYGDALAAATAARPEDVVSQLNGLIVLDRLDDAAAVVLRHEHDEWVDGRVAAMFHYARAYLAWRDGDRPKALERLHDALESEPGFSPAKDTQEGLLLGALLEDSPDWQLGDLSNWWPMDVLVKLRDGKPARDDEVTDLMGPVVPHVDHLQRATALCGHGRELALLLLKKRALDGGAAAREAMLACLRVPCGPDQVRVQLLEWMFEHDIVEVGTEIELFGQGRLAPVQRRALRIHAETSDDHALRPDAQALYEKAFQFAQDRALDKALQCFVEADRLQPDTPRVLTAIANAKRALEHPAEEIEALSRRAWALAPDYLFARTGMVVLHADKGEVDAAKDLLSPLLEQTEFHYSEWRSVLGAQLAIAKAEENVAQILELSRQLQDLASKF